LLRRQGRRRGDTGIRVRFWAGGGGGGGGLYKPAGNWVVGPNGPAWRANSASLGGPNKALPRGMLSAKKIFIKINIKNSK
jgi:hypothetical protein